MKRLAAPAALALAAVLLPAVSLPGTALAQDGSAAANAAPALARLDADDALIVLVDFTSGLYPIVDTIDVDEMLNNAVALAKIAETFDIPVMVLGDEGGFYGQMYPAIKALAGPDQPFERTTPSAWASGGFRAAVEATGRGTVLIGGITTDNCTLLTSLDLLRAGYDVRVVTDISGADSEHLRARRAEPAARRRRGDDGLDLGRLRAHRRLAHPRGRSRHDDLRAPHERAEHLCLRGVAERRANRCARRGVMMSLGEFEHRRTSGGDVSIHYLVSGEGPAVLFVHGWPQHSLMWHTIAPLIVEAGFRTIVPDQRGAGASDIPAGGYDKTTMAKDLVAVLDDAGVERAHVVGYDLGAGTAAALARDAPDRVDRLVVAEFGLPGFGYEEQMAPKPEWTIGSNWHLSLFTVPDAAMWLMQGREAQMLDWFFQHISYRGTSAVSAAHFEQYLRHVRKPGALRAGISYYAAVWQDAADNASLETNPLTTMALG